MSLIDFSIKIMRFNEILTFAIMTLFYDPFCDELMSLSNVDLSSSYKPFEFYDQVLGICLSDVAELSIAKR